MIDARFVPLEKWPGERTPSHRQKASQFRASYTQTLDLLESELGHLGAKEIVIQAAFRREQLRNDGWPKSSAEPDDVAVIVSFETRQGQLSFPADRYDTFDDNLRAIALSLQALRAVDRYGVTRRAEQYSGWKQLPPPKQSTSFNSRREAADFMSSQAYNDLNHSTRLLFDQEYRQATYRTLAARMHPDRQDGSHDLFVVLQSAMQTLEKSE